MSHSLRLGIDLGGTTAKVGVVDERAQVLHAISVPTPMDFSQAADAMAAAVHEVAAFSGCTVQDFPFAGAGVPSMINPRTGHMVFANNTGWHDAPMREALEQRLGIPIHLANDADCALLAEAQAGAAQGADHALMITLGTGVGSAIILNGHLFTGGDGMGMEAGHLPLVAGGYPCTCGARGCLEAYASATGLAALAREELQQENNSALRAPDTELTGRTIFSAANQGDAAAIRIIDRYCALLAQGLGGLITVFRPQVVIVGGGISHAGAPLFDRLHTLVPQFVFAHEQIGTPDIRPAALGNEAGIVGAAFLDRA
jgi:glucokinase